MTTNMEIEVAEHPLLRAAAFSARFEVPLGALPGDAAGVASLLRDADGRAPPVQRDESLRQAVRDMLRASGYRPTGRGKPASEYLIRASGAGELGTINVAVDVCNAVSLHSGFPISVVDLGLLTPPLCIDVAQPGDSYVFNRAGHEIDLTGLVCLFDDMGPCANAVKDAQRTKTRSETRETLSVVWGVAGYEDRLADTVKWYRSLLEGAGATTEQVAQATGP
jgi:DNA/RNA-binding domain of Phe-tRNA-synthetase-like protein